MPRSGWIATLVLLTSTTIAHCQYGDISDVKLIKPEDGKDAPTVKAPAGATALFSGKNLDHWVKTDGKSKPGWKLVDGAMQVQGGNIMTKETFGGKFHLHVEFRCPYEPKRKGQGRGNSGVYVQGRYEIQVLDSYQNDTYKDGSCGAIYGISAPKVNACKAPTVWQTYDIYFTAPTCVDGKKTAPGTMTVIHNGVTIQENVKLTKNNTAAGRGGNPCEPGPIMLQDHGNPVQYRNIWIKQLD